MFSQKVEENSHNSWIILHNKVYDLNLYMDYHPGGKDILKPFLG